MSPHGTRPSENALSQRIERIAAARGMPEDPKVRAAAVAELSETYTRHRDRLGEVAGNPASLLARLVFFLPRDMHRMQLPLQELDRADALPSRREWRILDLGAGLGAATLGAAWFAAAHDAADGLSVVAVDHDSAALDILRALFEEPGALGLPPTTIETRAADATSLGPPTVKGPFDLIVAGLVLNELWNQGLDEASAARWIHRWVSTLAPGGSMIVIEPALREPTQRLMHVRDLIAAEPGPPTVFAPCIRRDPCPMRANARDWCHTEVPGRLPDGVAALATAAGLRTQRHTLAYLTLRADDRHLEDVVRGHVGEPYRVVSGLLRSKGKCERLGCGRSGLVRWIRLDRHAGPATADWEQARRGDLVVTTGTDPAGPRVRLGPGTQVRGVTKPCA